VTDPVIRASGLRKSYGDTEAVRGIDLTVRPGEIFAFLGPNGAGKTTTVEVLEGYRERTGGEVSVLGSDPATAGRGWRARVGIVLQQSKTHPELSVAETLELFAGYYPQALPVRETIAQVGLEEKAGTRVARLSGGQQRRLDVGMALIGDPELLFLDEPTTGFDPSARRQFWGVIEGLRELGKTIFLTTHYMEEAQRLADRVAIVVSGRIVAEGTPAELVAADRDATTIRFRLPPGSSVDELPSGMAASAPGDGSVMVEAAEPVRVLHELTGWALERDLDLEGLEVRRPSLEDVYLQLTGDAAGAGEGAEEDG
jgi:ABC-2 type transport system ATP-binding protein